jgi:hypothetical protein
VRYCKQGVIIDPSEEGLWIIPAFEPKAETEARPTPTENVGQSGAATSREIGSGGATAIGEKPSATVRRVMVRGAVPVENWGELFRSFVGPGTRLNLKRQRLGVDFELEFPDGGQITATDATLKAMKEAARQLGLEFEIQE